MRIDVRKAQQHFLRTDPVMTHLMRLLDEADIQLTIPKPVPPSAYGSHLTRAIIAQQLSTQAARTITERVRTVAGGLEPTQISAQSDAPLRAAGLSSQKVRYLRALAAALPSRTTHVHANQTNQEIIAALTTIPGIGIWTAEMFLIFALARSDVFTLRDLGLRESLAYYYRLQSRHLKKRERIIAGWHPHETVASLVLWKARDTKLPRP